MALTNTKVRVAYSSLPIRPPFVGGVTLWLLLDRFDLHSSWIGGIAYSVLAIFWVTFFYSAVHDRFVELFDKAGNPTVGSTIQTPPVGIQRSAKRPEVN